MPKFSFSNMPPFQTLTKEDVIAVHYAALDLLEKVGVEIHSDEALKLLADAGADVDFDRKLARIPQHLVCEAVRKAPSTIKLYSRDRKHDVVLEGNKVHFYPGSSVPMVYDGETKKIRPSTSEDCANLAKIVDALEYIDSQFAAIVVSDVPVIIRDRYRYYVWLKNTTKHVMVSSFTLESPSDIRALAAVIAGGEEELDRRPYVSSIVCPSPPLKWSELTCQNLMDYAKYSIPTVILPMPQINATGPATLAANVVQSAVEGLSGLVLAQLVRAGAPIILGTDAVLFDLRTANIVASIESYMVCCAFAQMSKFYGLPSHTYAGGAGPILDAQYGLQAAASLELVALSGINLVSGPGLMGGGGGGAQSFEKMVIDNEICGIVYRLIKGIDVNDATLARDLFEKIGPGGFFLKERHTNEWFTKEQFMPSHVINRYGASRWEAKGSKDIFQRARERVKEILATHVPEPLSSDVERELDDVMRGIAKKYNIKTLPYGPSVE